MAAAASTNRRKSSSWIGRKRRPGLSAGTCGPFRDSLATRVKVHASGRAADASRVPGKGCETPLPRDYNPLDG